MALLLIPVLAMPGSLDLLPVGGPILGYELSLLLVDIASINDDPDPLHLGRGGNADPEGDSGDDDHGNLEGP